MTSRAATVDSPLHSASLAGALRLPFDWLGLGLALASVAWLVFALAPGPAPAWPSVSMGFAALLASRMPGRPIPRGTGTFLAVLGIVGGLAQIAAFWAIAQALP